MRMRQLIARPDCLAVCALVITLLAVPNLLGQDTNLRATAFGGGSFLKAEHSKWERVVKESGARAE